MAPKNKKFYPTYSEETKALKQSEQNNTKLINSLIAGFALLTGATKAATVNQKEEEIVGTRVTDTVSGTYAIDWNAGSVFILTMTANTTFSDSNLPTGTETKVITVELAGAFVATFPSYYEARPSNDAYDITVRNELTVNCKNGTSSGENVTYGLENLAT
jgi:hypothetical protein